MTWVLTNEATHEDVSLPIERLTFRGEKVTVTDFIPPRHAASSGRVVCQYADGQEQTFFPSVVGLFIRQVD